MTTPTRETLDDYVTRGLVRRQTRGALAIYNYAERCTFDRAWDHVTTQARGLIFDGDTLIARPFRKFFNHGEPEAPKVTGEPDSVAVKYDGSLGVSYRDPETGRIRWATRGSLDSPQSAVAERIWRERRTEADAAGIDEAADDVTFLVEIVGPETRVICRYPEPALVLLGVRHISSGADAEPERVRLWGDVLGLPVAETVPGDFASLLNRARTLPHGEEGWVARWGDERVKVKGAAYLSIARVLAGIASPRNVADIWYARDDSIRALLPEEFRGDLDAAFADLARAAAEVEAELEETWARVSGIADRKAIVEAVGTGSRVFPLVMQRVGGKTPDARMVVYRERFDGKPRPVGSGGEA